MTKRKVENVTGALAERTDDRGRRRIKLTKAEREQLRRQELASTAAFLFLDLTEARTWKQIADEMNLSAHQLRDLTKTEEFDVAYNDLFVELGKDPRYRAAQGALADMLPLAMTELKNLLTDNRTPAGTRLKAIDKVMALNGVENLQPQQSDRQELVQFLVAKNINIDAVGVPVPDMYMEHMGDVIDAEMVNADTEDDNSLEEATPLLPEGDQED
jgi:hypothetical protein